MSNDPRYDAVGSSSLREELFNTFLKAHQTSTTPEPAVSRETASPPTNETPEVDAQERERQRAERKDRAVKEREEKVKAERSKVEAAIDRSRTTLTKEEGELEFKCADYLSSNCPSYSAPLITPYALLLGRC